jgi:hypothetical protein
MDGYPRVIKHGYLENPQFYTLRTPLLKVIAGP